MNGVNEVNYVNVSDKVYAGMHRVNLVDDVNEDYLVNAVNEVNAVNSVK